MRAAVTIMVALSQVAPALAGDQPRRTWGESAAGLAYDAGRGVNRMLDWAGLPNGLKPEDGGHSTAPPVPVQPTKPATTTLELKRTYETPPATWGDTFYGWGLGAAQGADWAYGKAWSGKEAVAPYVLGALDATKGAGTAAWSGTLAGIDAASPYAGAAWDATRRMGQAGYGLASDGFRSGIDNLPVVIDWSADFAAAGATAFVSIGGSTLACGIATTPLAAVSAGAAYLVCIPVIAAGGYGGQQLLRGAYDMYGRVPNETAFAMGSIVGGLAGGTMANKGVIEFAQWRLRNQYGDFQTYSKAARALSAKNIRAWDPNVKDKWTQGLQVDHIQSLKCGWTHGVSVATIAAARNFQYLPAKVNQSLGAKGC